MENINQIDFGAGEDREPSVESVGFDTFDPEKASRERLKVELQEHLDEGRSKEEILNGYKRPIDVLVSGRRPMEGENQFSGACRARFNLDIAKMRETPGGEIHYRRMMGYFVNNDMGNPDSVDANTYAGFVNKYKTIADFEEPATVFIKKLGEVNTPEKTLAYETDLARMKALLFGAEQEKAWSLLRDMQAHEKKTVTELLDDERAMEVDETKAPEVSDNTKDVFEGEPQVGDDLGNGYLLDVRGGFNSKDEAYRFPRLEGQDIVKYQGQWYIARRRR